MNLNWIKLIIILLLNPLLYFYFSDGINNVLVTHKTLKIDKMDLSKYIYSSSLEDDQLVIYRLNKTDIENEYCKSIDVYHSLGQIISMYPVIIICDPMINSSQLTITNGAWNYEIENNLNSEKKISIEKVKNDFSLMEIEKLYCKKLNLYLKSIISYDPITVACGFPDEAQNSFIVSNKWQHLSNFDSRIIGQNELYLLRKDYSLIDINSGKITESDFFNNKEIRDSQIKFNANYPVAISKNNRIFVFELNGGDKKLSEIHKNGIKTHVIQLPHSFLSTSYPQAISSSDDGNYLYMVVENGSRWGFYSIYFYIVEVESNSIIFSKKLEGDYINLWMNMNNKSNRINFTYSSKNIVHAYQIELTQQRKIK